MAVLRGGRNSLVEFSPILVLEINEVLLQQAGTSASEVADFLIELGYRLFGLTYRKLSNWSASRVNDFSEVIALPGLPDEASSGTSGTKGI